MVANYTIPADFAMREPDGSVRLTAEKTTAFIIDRGIQLAAGALVRLSDGDVAALGILESRDGAWVATDLRWEPR